MVENNSKTDPQPFAPTQRPVRVAITQGDINGVGIELILKTFADTEMLSLCTPVVYGHEKVFNFHRKHFGLTTPFRLIASADEAQPGQLNFINCSDDDIKVEFGRQSAEAGHAAFVSLEAAVCDVKDGKADVLVTAPVNKASIQSANFHFAGHTEYLQDRCGGDETEPLMVLFNDMMRVALVTTHLPVSEVAFAVTEERVMQKARMLYETLCRDFCLPAPRIAALALNPHAGDNGVFGHEEEDVIIPAVKSLSDAGIPCYGPYAADGFFGAGQYRHFDGVLAMYHDQGLAPFKALSCEGGVNFTAGLSIIRTSPDHGTAYDIAGRGVAQCDSFRKAVFSAIDIFHNRSAYDKAHENPLPKLYQDKKER